MPPRLSGVAPRAVCDMVIQKPKKASKQTVASLRKSTTDGVVSTLYNPVSVPLLEVDLPRQLCPYIDSLPPAERPQFSQLWEPDAAVDVVECTFGTVPQNCALAYQQRLPHTDSSNHIVLTDIPEPPTFTFTDFCSYLQPYLPLPFDVSDKFHSLQVSVTESTEYEVATRSQAISDQWHKLRKNRITASVFKRVCSRRGDHDTLASTLLATRCVTTPAIKFGIEKEPVAAQLYSSGFGRNVYQVGLVINPSCSFLGASPDRRVYDPDVPSDPWGLLEIKCTMKESVAQCGYLSISKDTGHLELKRSHDYYCQVQGQMGLTGCTWCDFMVYSDNEFHVERIIFDADFFRNMMEKLTRFFFRSFVQQLTF